MPAGAASAAATAPGIGLPMPQTGPTGSAAPRQARNAAELQQHLLQDRTPADLQPVTAERGCGPAGCVVDVGTLVIERDRGRLRTAQGRPLPLVHPGERRPASLPPPDWEPLAAYAVMQQGQRQGWCLELAHSGAGSSGSLARWGTVVWVPDSAQRPARQAYRLVGYWAGCAALSSAEAGGPLALPVVQRGTAAAELALRAWRCTPAGCVAEPLAVRARLSPGAQASDNQVVLE